MLSGEAINTNFIVLGSTRSALEPKTYHMRDEYVNHYTTAFNMLSMYVDI
jgi:hypothetical protein